MEEEGFDSIFSLGGTKRNDRARRCRRDEEGTGARRRPDATIIIIIIITTTTTTRRTRETRRTRGGDPREEKNNENAIGRLPGRVMPWTETFEREWTKYSTV